MKKTIGERIFTVCNTIFLILLSLIMLFPFWEVIKTSFSTPAEASSLTYYFWPKEPTLTAYKQVVENSQVWIGYKNTLLRIIYAMLIQMPLTIFTAYALSHRKLPDKNFWTFFVVLTKFVSGGLIPLYLVVRSLGLLDNSLSMILPAAINVFYLLIVRNFFLAIPNELEEAASIDGASTVGILFRIILPLSKPILMTLAMWIIVGNWNAWFDCLMYIQTPSKFVLQTVLRKIIIDASPQNMETTVITADLKPNAEIIKCATIIVSTLPIMVVYPFIQKYFVKGTMVGAVKG